MITRVQTRTVLITPVAIEIVRGLLQQQKLDESYALRVYITGQTCSGFQYGMAFDNKPRETDATFESGGIKVLVDESSMLNMAGATVDYIDNELGKGFLVDNPNAVPSCSCESQICKTSEN